MFESIQDYLCQEIDKEKLFNNIITSKEYVNSSQETKEGIDLFIEELKDIKDEKEFAERISEPTIYNRLNILLEDIDLFNLATRTCGGPVPMIDLDMLLGFIDAAIEHLDDERVFRLAYNYDFLLEDKSIVEDYFIKNKNAFYINELACNELSNINYEKLSNALIDIGNIEELKYFVKNVYNKDFNKKKVLEKIIDLEK